MRTRTRLLASCLALLTCLGGLALAGPPFGQDDWKCDVVHRKRGKPPLSGLVLEQTPTEVRFKYIQRRPGRPTVVLTETLLKADIDRLELLDPEERARLVERLQALSKERESLAARLRLLDGGKFEPPDDSDLKAADWGKDGKGKALAFESTHFRLVSNAREDIVYVTAAHLEQVYAAYLHTLPPRVADARPSTILLARSWPDYQAVLREHGYNLLNPAVFDPARNQVVCFSDLQRLNEANEQVRRQHDRSRADLKAREAELNRLYKNKVPQELLSPLQDAHARMRAVEERNDSEFKESRRRLFQRLTHEAFHAYLANYVYPAKDGEAPQWLNEGLAQIFETAVIELGELRVGLPDRERLARVQALLKKNEFPSLRELLEAGPRQFVVAHQSDQAASDRFYLAAWALAFHLSFETRVLGTRALDDYVQARHRGTEPLAAFRDLAGQPLSAFEKEFRHYLQTLRSDGSRPR